MVSYRKVSVYGGLALKEHFLSNELLDESGDVPSPHERAMQARIVQYGTASIRTQSDLC